jgi:metal-responsive CopG/Arc/MetJ family transcriptional regulator
MSTQEIARFSVLFPKGTLEKLEKHKGRYISRNKYILRAVEQYLNNEENKTLVGASVTSHKHLPEPEEPSPGVTEL